jgi:Nitrate/TMAO reductases, membrane-bound tetraheme cytochrome c subunit
MSEDDSRRFKWKAVSIAFICGAAFVAVAGISIHATDQRAFCSQCHSMAPQAWSHANSTHAQFSCNECHTPSNLVKKLPFKAKVGLHDLYVTATSSVPPSIHATNEMKEVLKENCIRCHSSTIQEVAMDVKPFCTDCHRSIPHNSRQPMDQREAADV